MKRARLGEIVEQEGLLSGAESRSRGSGSDQMRSHKRQDRRHEEAVSNHAKRVIDALQLTERYSVATPVNWKFGDEVIIVPTISDEEARNRFPDGWEQPLPYIRVVRQPSDA